MMSEAQPDLTLLHHAWTGLDHVIERSKLGQRPWWSRLWWPGPNFAFDPYWYRAMYMLAVVESGPEWAAMPENGSRERALELVRQLEETLARLSNRWRPAPIRKFLEPLKKFLEMIEPDALVLLAMVLADQVGRETSRGEPARSMLGQETLRHFLGDAEPFDSHGTTPSNPPRKELRGKLNPPLPDPSYVIDFVVQNLKLTPRGRYNLACYHSGAAQRLAAADLSADQRSHLRSAAVYLGDALALLDAAMLAWARVDPDLTALRTRDPEGYRQALRSSPHQRRTGAHRP